MALVNHDLTLEYQPIFELDSGRKVLTEALVRWRQGGKTVCSPDVFIPIAEKCGLITPIGEFVIDAAMRCLAGQLETQNYEGRLAINVSPQQFVCGQSISSYVEASLNKYRLNGNQICIEITETTPFIFSDRCARELRRLRELGVVIYLDDFASGFLGIRAFVDLEIDGIKLAMKGGKDRAYAPKQQALVKAFWQMCHDLDLDLIVEGIETAEQIDWLSKFPGLLGQGFHLGCPAGMNELSLRVRVGET
ncbi:EAL domain-containing protein [Pandoraea sp. NPDC090278]|uniref:EAL domain-containing protein n=1 Tax=Pandoraea sp. NPDC090278 TaxID=3364391 RepID=UPI00383A9E31